MGSELPQAIACEFGDMDIVFVYTRERRDFGRPASRLSDSDATIILETTTNADQLEECAAPAEGGRGLTRAGMCRTS